MTNPVRVSTIHFYNAFGKSYAADVFISTPDATVADLLAALDAWAAETMADCYGCDGCCWERAPLIAADIPRLATLLPATAFPAHAVCAAFAEVTVDAAGAADITLARDSASACQFLDPGKKACRNWQTRAFVCRSHFCLPRSNRLAELRQDIVNAGENELTRLLLAEEAAGAAALPCGPLANLLKAEDYPQTAISNAASYADMLLKDCASPALWQALTQKHALP